MRHCFIFHLLLTLLLAAPLAGCKAGPRDYTNENDRLRSENAQLQDQVKDLEAKVQARVDQLKAMEARTAATRPAVEGVKASDIPVAVSVKFGDYSGAIDTHGSGSDDLLRLYIRTLDQRDRFIPVAGKAAVQAVYIQPGEKPVVVGEANLDAAALHDAYRTGLTGTHYTLEIPLPAKLPDGCSALAVKLTLTDANTGATLSTERVFPVQRQ